MVTGIEKLKESETTWRRYLESVDDQPVAAAVVVEVPAAAEY